VSNRQERRRAERDAKKTPQRFEMSISLLQPWSVPVIHTKLPPEILNTMIELTDEIIDDKQSVSHGRRLAGQIDTELLVPHELLKRDGTMNFFTGLARQFIRTARLQNHPTDTKSVLSEEIFIKMLSMWIVSQQPNEYNPIHIHTECHLSSVMYLKVPKFESSKKTHRSNDDGSVTFISNGSVDTEFSTPQMQIKPTVGDFFIFGSKQLHTVYPYRCEEGDPERRSVSFNAIYETDHHRKLRKDGDSTKGYGPFLAETKGQPRLPQI